MPLLNINFKPHLALVASDAAWDVLKLVITDYLDANAGTAVHDEAAIRSLSPAFADDRIWAQVLHDVGLDLIQ